MLGTADASIELGTVVRPIDHDADLETLLWTDGEDAVFAAASRGVVDASTQLVVARALVNAGKWQEAMEPLMRLVAGTTTLAARARALLAYIRYYQGDFPLGVSDADAALDLARWDGLARAEAHLYASVNLTALNDAVRAEERARKAHDAARNVRPPGLRDDLRFRIARQLTHVLVAAGHYGEGAAQAETAALLARRTRNRRNRGLASYLRAHVAAARGDSAALGYFASAISEWGPNYEGLHRWVRYCVACFHRDIDDVPKAHMYRVASGMRLTWEEPLFDLAEARPSDEPTPASDDERPFCLATTGLLRFLGPRPETAEKPFTMAAATFEAGGLHHYRRGAALGLAATYARLGRMNLARDIVRDEIIGLERANLVRWPWWHRMVASTLAHTDLGAEAARMFQRCLAQPYPPHSQGTGPLGVPELSQREREVIVAWLRHPGIDRPQLANMLGISEASVRNHINRVRRKLGVRARRGPEALRLRLDELRTISTAPL